MYIIRVTFWVAGVLFGVSTCYGQSEAWLGDWTTTGKITSYGDGVDISEKGRVSIKIEKFNGITVTLSTKNTYDEFLNNSFSFPSSMATVSNNSIAYQNSRSYAPKNGEPDWSSTPPHDKSGSWLQTNVGDELFSVSTTFNISVNAKGVIKGTYELNRGGFSIAEQVTYEFTGKARK
jgi:hypothetical protein